MQALRSARRLGAISRVAVLTLACGMPEGEDDYFLGRFIDRVIDKIRVFAGHELTHALGAL